MEDHSLDGYLRRRSTEELESLLAYCLQDEIYANYKHVILEILRILEERFVPDMTSEEVLRVKEKLLQYKPKE